MTKRMQELLDEVSRLSDEEQESWAESKLQELRSERRWDDLFERSGTMLDAMIAEAEGERRQGLVKPLNLDDM